MYFYNYNRHQESCVIKCQTGAVTVNLKIHIWEFNVILCQHDAETDSTNTDSSNKSEKHCLSIVINRCNLKRLLGSCGTILPTVI